MPPSKPIVRSSDKPRAGKKPIVPHMNTTMFAETFEGLGTEFRWSRAVVCPCRLDDMTEQPDPTCVLCGGKGIWYRNPEAENEKEATRDYLTVKAIFSSATVNPDLYTPNGRWDHGDATLSLYAEARVTYRDRFVAMQQEIAWSELLVRDTSSDIVSVGKGGRTTTKKKSTMRYPAVSVQIVATRDEEYHEGYDFILTQETKTEPRQLKWLPGMGPANEEIYTIHYICRPVWVVDKETYAIQNSVGPKEGILGKNELQFLPTTFAVRLDFMTEAQGT